VRALFDIVHPAHVHFFRHVHARLLANGHECHVVARDREMTVALLDTYEIPHETYGRPHHGRLRQAGELAARDLRLVRVGRRFRPDVVLARNPSGMHAARVLRATGVFDTDDGTAGGPIFKLAKPFARVITTPECITEDFGAKHVRYPGYKALAFLHPDLFTPDPSVRDDLGVGNDPYSIVRLTAMASPHDTGEQGVSSDVARAVVDRLQRAGRVFVSTEAEMPEEFRSFAYRIRPDRMHDAMAFASLVVGDSGSMVGEAAVLGTPAIFYGSFAHRREYLPDLEQRWGLARTFLPEQRNEFLAAIDDVLADPTSREVWQERRQKMLASAVNVADWYVDLLERLHADGTDATLEAMR
jgi:uncharacterized protein